MNGTSRLNIEINVSEVITDIGTFVILQHDLDWTYIHKGILHVAGKKLKPTFRHKLPNAYKVMTPTVFDSLIESFSSAKFKCVPWTLHMCINLQIINSTWYFEIEVIWLIS